MALGGVLIAISAFAPAASAGGLTPPFFNTDTDTYDTYLHDAHRGTGADADGFEGECPNGDAVDGLTAWHLILTDSDQEYVTVDVRVSIDGVATTLSLTKATTLDGFDPTANFLASPTAKHAYVYAGDADDVLVDAAAQVTPDGPADKIVLSHICPGDEDTDDGGTTDTGTTDTGGTDDVLGSTGSQDTGGTDTEVKGNVVEPQQLPATGSGDRSLFIIGMGFLTAGAIAMVARRQVTRS
jgi:LPXTG-motif cell wall-anchored protein